MSQFIGGLAERHKELGRTGPDWLRGLREKQLARFRELGLPTSRHEEWKNTNLAPLVGTGFRPATQNGAPASLPEGIAPDLGGPRLVLYGGRVARELSTADAQNGVQVLGFDQALQQMPERIKPYMTRDDSGSGAEFRALNGALGDDGAVIVVGDDVQAASPVQLTFVAGEGADPTAVHPRTLVVVGRNSRLRLVETYAGGGQQTYFTNSVSEIVVGEGSTVEHYRFQLESEEAFHISSITSRQARDSHYTSYNINLGGRLARHHVRAVLDGEGSYCDLNGLSLTRDAQHVDNHTVLDHAKPHCGSRELYKGVLAGRSRSVFSGRIIVRKDAQKTDAKQSNPSLLLSPHALAHTRPQLEIHADDVKCTHGATIGQVDDEAVFYLRSRGVPAGEARRLLVQAFAGEVLEPMQIEPLRDWLQARIDRRLAEMAP